MSYIAKITILTTFLLIGTLPLYSQGLRLEEGQWTKVSGCSFCLTCECLKCPYEGTDYTNDGTSYGQTKYKEIPIIRETATIFAYCGNQLIGEYYLERNNTCNGNYTYTSDITYLRTKDGYMHNPQIKYNNGYNLIKMDAEAYCNAGEKRKTVEQIEATIRNKSANLAGNFPKTNIQKSEIANVIWENLKREETYSFGNNEVVCRAVLINDQRRGKWKFLDDKQLIEIDWEASQYKPANREIVSIVHQSNGYYTLYSSYENTEFSGPALKAYKYVANEKVYEDDYIYLRDNLGLGNLKLLSYCDKCYWEGKEYNLGETVVRNSTIYKKELIFKCTNNGNSTYWSSELLDNPYLTEFNSDYCLICDDKKGNSPGFYNEWKDYYGNYVAVQCIVFREKNKKIESTRKKIQDIEELVNPPDITFAPNKIKGKWILTITKTHDWNTVDLIKEEERFKRSHNAEINFHIDNNKVSGIISSGKSFHNDARAYGDLIGQNLEIYLEKYGDKKYIITGDFTSAVEFSGKIEPLKVKGRYNNDTFWGTVTGKKVKIEKSLVPVSESSPPKQDDPKKEKSSSKYEKIIEAETETFNIADYKNLETWTYSNGLKSMENGKAILRPEKKKDAVKFSSPTLVVPQSAKAFYLDFDKSNIKNGIIKVLVKDLKNNTKEEIYSEKIQVSLNDINRTLGDLSNGRIPSGTASNKKTKPHRIAFTKYRGQKIQIEVNYKATGMSKPGLIVKSVNIK